MRKQVTNISVSFASITKGKRKETNKFERIMQLDGHVIPTPDEMNEIERKAWQYIDSTLPRNKVLTGRIQVNFGEEEGDIVMIQLLPKKTQLIMRSN